MSGFDYQFEKFGTARELLKHRQPGDEAKSIATAFDEIERALVGLDVNGLDKFARKRMTRLESLMDTSGVDPATNPNLQLARARQMSGVERDELLKLVEALADWFGRKS